VSASEGQRFAEIVSDMTERLRALGPSRVKADLQADLVER
jgi:coenzyme F420-reducing hydrogenase delta subunit